MRLDKHNALRLKSHDTGPTGNTASGRGHLESGIDHLWVDFPHVRALCDSRQYYALYVIVLDLLLYSEPLEKTRNERLEKIMLASDFSDLTGAPDLVIGLQERIQQLEEIKTAFQINEKYLDKQGWSDRIEVENRHRSEAQIDALTGLGNRRSFEEASRQSFADAQRDDRKLSLVGTT